MGGEALLRPTRKAVEGVEIIPLKMRLGRTGEFFDPADARTMAHQQFAGRKDGKSTGRQFRRLIDRDGVLARL